MMSNLAPPWYVRCPEATEVVNGFQQEFNKILDENPNIAKYLKDLDARSSETFNHSINVALHVYKELSRSGEYMPHDIHEWTKAALCHDVGKLTTDIDVLHSNVNLKDQKDNAENLREMMRHSIDSVNLARATDEITIKGQTYEGYGFGKYEVTAAIGHHINASALENGFNNADLSRPQWGETYPEGYVEYLLKTECHWMKERDIKALETISFCDDIEALRADDRRYQRQHNWEMSDFTQDASGKSKGYSVQTIMEGATDKDIAYLQSVDKYVIKSNIEQGRIGKQFEGKVSDKEFQKEFDALQDAKVPMFARQSLIYRQPERKPELSEYKIKDILGDPSQNQPPKPYLGLEFFEEEYEEGMHFYKLDLGEQGTLVFPALENGLRGPNFEMKPELITPVMLQGHKSIGEVISTSISNIAAIVSETPTSILNNPNQEELEAFELSADGDVGPELA